MVTRAFGKNAMQGRTDQGQTAFENRLADAAGGSAFALSLMGRDC
jgi:hypothetical protein